MRVLYLYSEVMGYTKSTLEALLEQGHEVHIVFWDTNRISSYELHLPEGIDSSPRSEMNLRRIIHLAERFKPDVIVTSGWMDKTYAIASAVLKAKGHFVVIALDEQWRSTSKQKFLNVLGLMGFFRIFFSGAWVCGRFQYELCRRLGFNRDEIGVDLYSADRNMIDRQSRANKTLQPTVGKKRFVFVGRFETTKGLPELLAAWQSLSEYHDKWELHLIGEGSIKPREVNRSVVLHPFLQPEELFSELAHADCFVLPSTYEPWGVVVHEFACLGRPMIVSDAVGAASTFLLSGLNGYAFKAGSTESLSRALRNFMGLSDEQRKTMGQHSFDLSARITPQSSAASLVALVNTRSQQ